MSGRFAVLAPLFALPLALLASAQVPSPTVEGPITSPGAAFIGQTTGFDLGQVGYRQEEYFFSGTARAFVNVGPLGADGMWTVAEGDSTAFKSRLLVYRPIERKNFNGTLIVEWLNVSGGVDASPDWTLSHTELLRKGYAWAGVSAQKVGVEGGGGLLGVVDLGLKKVNPARYGSLSHPGDSFSYDIFSQAAQALRQASGPLYDLRVKKVIAIGESQSAFRLVTYVNAIHPVARLFDGYLVHSRGSSGAPLAERPLTAIPVPGNTPIRTDIDVPVLTLETESDLTFLQFFPARQDDARNIRLWEAAGTSHADTYITVKGSSDLGTSPDIVGLVLTPSPLPGIIDCNTLINSGPHHWVVKAAISALNRWVRSGKAPKSARLEVNAGPPVTIARDEHGNGVGGVRTPQVDVPIATFTGEQDGSILCRLFGSTTPFDAAKLASLYPTHEAFVSAYNKAVKRAVRAGWVLPADGKLMKKWAAGAAIGG